jgi:hypothetical protein
MSSRSWTSDWFLNQAYSNITNKDSQEELKRFFKTINKPELNLKRADYYFPGSEGWKDLKELIDYMVDFKGTDSEKEEELIEILSQLEEEIFYNDKRRNITNIMASGETK